MDDIFIHQDILTNGVRLHVVQSGPEEGPLVILLHGFPEFWYGWRKQIPALTAAGFRVWCPDQRGYNLSQKPDGIAAYSLDTLAADIVGLVDAAGQEKACIVGHDWGAGVAWWMAGKYPERIEKLGILNVPHPVVFQRYLRSHPSQLLKSLYILFFQIPWLPEALARLGNWAMPAGALVGSSRPGAFNAEDLQEYRQAWAQPRAYSAMLNWYRAALQTPSEPPIDQRNRVPTLILWGAQDRFLERETASLSLALCTQGRLEFLEEATHWLQHEEPERVNTLLIDFLTEQKSS